MLLILKTIAVLKAKIARTANTVIFINILYFMDKYIGKVIIVNLSKVDY